MRLCAGFMRRLENVIETATMQRVEEHASPEVAAGARARRERGEANDDG